MNDQLQKALGDFISLLIKGVEAGASFASEQLPQIIQEKILWGRIYETFTMVAILAVIVGLLKGAEYCAKFEERSHEGIYAFVAMVSGVFAIILSLVLLFCQIPLTIQVWFAPRLYVLEWLRTFLAK